MTKLQYLIKKHGKPSTVYFVNNPRGKVPTKTLRFAWENAGKCVCVLDITKHPDGTYKIFIDYQLKPIQFPSRLFKTKLSLPAMTRKEDKCNGSFAETVRVFVSDDFVCWHLFGTVGNMKPFLAWCTT